MYRGLLAFFECLVSSVWLILILNILFTLWQLNTINKWISYFNAWFDLKEFAPVTHSSKWSLQITKTLYQVNRVPQFGRYY